MHGIASASMVELKVQVRQGGQTSTGPSQGDSSRGECTELVPGGSGGASLGWGSSAAVIQPRRVPEGSSVAGRVGPCPSHPTEFLPFPAAAFGPVLRPASPGCLSVQLRSRPCAMAQRYRRAERGGHSQPGERVRRGRRATRPVRRSPPGPWESAGPPDKSAGSSPE